MWRCPDLTSQSRSTSLSPLRPSPTPSESSSPRRAGRPQHMPGSPSAQADPSKRGHFLGILAPRLAARSPSGVCMHSAILQAIPFHCRRRLLVQVTQTHPAHQHNLVRPISAEHPDIAHPDNGNCGRASARWRRGACGQLGASQNGPRNAVAGALSDLPPHRSRSISKFRFALVYVPVSFSSRHCFCTLPA